MNGVSVFGEIQQISCIIVIAACFLSVLEACRMTWLLLIRKVMLLHLGLKEIPGHLCDRDGGFQNDYVAQVHFCQSHLQIPKVRR